MFNPKSKDWQESEFTHWIITEGITTKPYIPGCERFKTPTQQHMIMLESLYQKPIEQIL